LWAFQSGQIPSISGGSRHAEFQREFLHGLRQKRANRKFAPFRLKAEQHSVFKQAPKSWQTTNCMSGLSALHTMMAR
ncbi:hypothetical protein, partial [Pseudomonas aeruginosa]|uniref:hypothetical protein n=1 Tax=Pseudomonas aeruginosa TaxID=287 RepID=UPI003D2C9DC8